MASASPKHVCANHSRVNPAVAGLTPHSLQGRAMVIGPMVTPRLKKRSRGISAICSGTICSAKMPMKIQSRPRKFIQDSAYAAKAAKPTENSTDGIVITSELRK